MTMTRCAGDCSLDVKSACLVSSVTAGGSASSLSAAAQTSGPALTGPRSSAWIWLYSLPEGKKFGCEAKKSTRSTLACICPETQVCMCVSEGSRHHVCIPAWGQDPSPCLLSPGAWPIVLRGTQWANMGEEGKGELEESRGLLHSCVVTLLRGMSSDLVKGESLPTSSLPWPWQWPLSFSSPFYHKDAWRPWRG